MIQEETIDFKQLEKEIRSEIKVLRETDSEKAECLEELIFSRDNELTKSLTHIVPDDEIKFYPGSINGPEPEDDPEAYGKWYYENQPKSIFPNGPHPKDLGVKFKYLMQKEDSNDTEQV